MSSLALYAHPKMGPQGRPATLGDGGESYSLRIPFSIQPLGKLRETDAQEGSDSIHRVTIGKRAATIESYGVFYVLRVPGFQKQQDAESFLRHAAVGLLRLSVEREMAIDFSPAASPLDTDQHNRQFRESFAQQNNPLWKRADGSYTDAGVFPHATSIVPEHKRVWEYFLGFGTEVKPLTPALLAEAIERTETVANPDELLQDEKLLLGIKTFGAGHNTWDKKSRFVSLVTVLEILKTQTDRPAFSQEVIKKFLELLSTFHPNGENEKQQREQLERDLVHMKKQSISSAICDLAFNSRSSTTIQPGSREESDKVVKRIYDIRSKLVHTGKVPPKAGIGSDQRLAEGFETVRIVSAEALQSLIEKHLK